MKVTIRPLVEADADTSYNWRNDPEVFKYTGNVYTEVITLETERLWISRVINNKDEYRCAIIADNKYVGNIYLTNIVKNESAVYHIFIGEKEYWGKGVGKKASIEIIKYGFNVLKLDYIYLKVRHENNNAIKLYDSLGFKCDRQDDEFLTFKLDSREFIKKLNYESLK